MSIELVGASFEVFRWYISALYMRVVDDYAVRSAIGPGLCDHLLYMLGEIEGGAGSTKQLGPQAANRWIGFVQGVLHCSGVRSIDELRADTVECAELAKLHLSCVHLISGRRAAIIHGGSLIEFGVPHTIPENEVGAALTEKAMHHIRDLWHKTRSAPEQ